MEIGQGMFSNNPPAVLQQQPVQSIQPVGSVMRDPEIEGTPAHISQQTMFLNHQNHIRQTHEPYIKWLIRLLRYHRLFFVYEIVSGNLLKHLLRTIRLGCLVGDSCIEKGSEWLQSRCTPSYMPLTLRPLFTGGFFLLILLFFFDYWYLTNFHLLKPLGQTPKTVIFVSCLVTVVIFILTGVKQSGELRKLPTIRRSNTILSEKPYLKNTDKYCTFCQMIKPLRAQHCATCGICTTKYHKHSIFLNKCIGSGNQVMYCLLMVAIIVATTIVLNYFVFLKLKGWLLFKIFFYFLNAHCQLQCIIDLLEVGIYGIWYNCTEYEMEHWQELSYLHHQDDSTLYQNAANIGFFKNLKESLMCCDQQQPQLINYQDIAKDGVTFAKPVKWTTSLMFHKCQLPNHPRKRQLAEKAYMEQQKMADAPKSTASSQDKEDSGEKSTRGRRRYKASNIQKLASTQSLAPAIKQQIDRNAVSQNIDKFDLQ